jgi:hypothetical protein
MCLLVGLVACSNSNDGMNMGGDASMGGLDGPKVFMDAPPNVPPMITISGKTTERGLSGTTNVAGVTIAVYNVANESTPLTMTTTNAQGDFTLMITTNSMPVDGYLLATKGGYVDLYMYGTGPFIENFTDANLNMITPGHKDFLSSLAGGNQMAGKGLIGLQVRDASGNPVAGATVSSSPASGAYKYNGANGLPDSAATMTSSDGVAFMFNVPSGPITVTAAKSGLTFHPHVVKAPADKMTTTSVTP